ncbi:MAG TPA: PAS domain-containing protein, partial [Polyangiaceae bacterium]
MEASSAVILVVDADGTILFTNRIEPVFANRGVVGHKIWEFAIGDAQARLRGKIREIIETKQAIHYEHPGYRSDGAEGWYEVRAIPVVEGGEVRRLLWSSQDITERVKAVEKLGFQARLLDSVSQPVIASSPEGVIIYWNEAAERALGYSQQEAIGQRGSELLRAVYGEGVYDAMVRALRSPSSA